METQTAWLVPNRVLYWKLSGDVTMQTFYDMMQALNSHLHDSGEKIHAIINARSANSLKGEHSNIRSLVRQVANHGSMGVLMVITHDFALQHQFNRVTVDFGTHLRYSNTFKSAWTSLRNIDTTLPYVAPDKPVSGKRKQNLA